jgi:peptide/nickel transport system substrate-binding protein
VNLQPLDRSALNQRGYIALQFDMIIESYGQGPDPDLGVERLYNSANIQNPPAPFTNSSGYRNPEVDRLFDQQRPLIELAKRKAVYDRIQEILWRDMPVLPIYSYSPPNVYRSTAVEGLYDWAYGNHENYMNAVRVWKEDPSAASGPPRRWLAWSFGAAAIVAAGLWAMRILRRPRDA